MLENYWWIWFALAAIFIIVEIFTAGFFILWFGVGAAVAGVLALLGLDPVWQWGAFVVVSAALFAGSRRFAERFSKKQPPGIGADRLIGKRGVVLEAIDDVGNTGRVRIDKEEWRADAHEAEAVPEGARVEVVRLEGTHVVVRQLKEEQS
jgi:membrane protein implicated in regulation of membrane protease activity